MADPRRALVRAVRRVRTGAAAGWARASRRRRGAALAVVAAVVAALVVVSVLTPSDTSRSADARAGGSDAATDDSRVPGGRPGAGAGRPDADPSAGAGTDPSGAARASGGTSRPRPTSGAAGPSSPTVRPTLRPDATEGGGSPSAGATAPAQVPAPAPATAVGVATPSPSSVGQEVDLGALRATVVSVEPVAVDARGPGEIAGPGAAVRLRVRNASSAPADLAGLAVTASSPDGVPAVPSGGEPAEPLAGALAPGEQRSGTYVFALPAGAGGAPALRVEVGSDAAREVAVVLAP